MNGTATGFAYGADGQLLFEASGNNTKAYVWLNGRPLARIDNNAAIYYYHDDQLGTPVAMTDAAGTTVWKADYEPFGEAAIRTQTVVNNLRLPGQYFDSETGLHYNYFRDYDPTTGRYVQADPIRLAGGLNLYAYVNGNPLSKVDPLGLFDTSVSGGGQVSGQFLVFGGSAGAGGVIGSNRQKCKYIQICLRAGMGFYAGAGANVSGTLGGGAEEGTSISFGVGGDIGLGASMGGQITAGSGGISGGGGKLSPGVGAGFSLGADMCITKTYDCSCF